ncbi:hypothetical protein R1flu_009631 [Riccia fluitans]|uniref:Uncharacterized protein n=1 Tax=Riccia fluitans TaxID=41844 RepID=A0ABD1Z2N6_9MARC
MKMTEVLTERFASAQEKTAEIVLVGGKMFPSEVVMRFNPSPPSAPLGFCTCISAQLSSSSKAGVFS